MCVSRPFTVKTSPVWNSLNVREQINDDDNDDDDDDDDDDDWNDLPPAFKRTKKLDTMDT